MKTAVIGAGPGCRAVLETFEQGKLRFLDLEILAVVDAYSALRSGRPYREPVSTGEAVRELRRNSGKQFDAEVVGALFEILETNGVGPGGEAGENGNPYRGSESTNREEGDTDRGGGSTDTTTD